MPSRKCGVLYLQREKEIDERRRRRAAMINSIEKKTAKKANRRLLEARLALCLWFVCSGYSFTVKYRERPYVGK